MSFLVIICDNSNFLIRCLRYFKITLIRNAIAGNHRDAIFLDGVACDLLVEHGEKEKLCRTFNQEHLLR